MLDSAILPGLRDPGPSLVPCRPEATRTYRPELCDPLNCEAPIGERCRGLIGTARERAKYQAENPVCPRCHQERPLSFYRVFDTGRRSSECEVCRGRRRINP